MSTGYGISAFDTAGYGKNADAVRAVAKAAETTGVDFDYLLSNAKQESGLNANAKSKTSSATGLFQFIESTWLSMVNKHGDKYGLGQYADKIKTRADGSCYVPDRAARNTILNLRKNPEICALMAAEFTAENKATLEAKTKADIGGTELYLAHFLGAGGASKFINKMIVNGEQKAATLFPEAAQSNRSVFYDKSGRARSLNDIYAIFDRKIGGSGDIAKPQNIASASNSVFDVRSSSPLIPRNDVSLAETSARSSSPREADGRAPSSPSTGARTATRGSLGLSNYGVVADARNALLLAQMNDAMHQATMNTFSRGHDGQRSNFGYGYGNQSGHENRMAGAIGYDINAYSV